MHELGGCVAVPAKERVEVAVGEEGHRRFTFDKRGQVFGHLRQQPCGLINAFAGGGRRLGIEFLPDLLCKITVVVEDGFHAHPAPHEQNLEPGGVVQKDHGFAECDRLGKMPEVKMGIL